MGTLTKRLVRHGVALLQGAVEDLLRDEPGAAQDGDAASYRPSVGHRPLEAAGSAAEAERMVRAGVPNMPAWAHIDGRDLYVMGAAVSHDGDGGFPRLRYADGDLVVTETSERCGCHHDTPDCPHRASTTAAP
jgi:methionyl-tRNA formyltransferase